MRLVDVKVVHTGASGPARGQARRRRLAGALLREGRIPKHATVQGPTGRRAAGQGVCGRGGGEGEGRGDMASKTPP